jgi:hypothetical protein
MKRNIFILAALATTGAAQAAVTTMVDFDNQFFATVAPAINQTFFFSSINTTSSGSNGNVSWWSDPTQSTAAAPNVNVVRVADVAGTSGTGPVPAGGDGTKAIELKFGFNGAAAVDGGNLFVNPFRAFLRGTSAASLVSSKIQNPAFDATKPMKFDIYSTSPLEVSIWLREADFTGRAIGQNPLSNTVPTGRGIVAVGGKFGTPNALPQDALGVALEGVGFEGGYVVPANTWVTLSFDCDDAINHTFRRITGTGGNIVVPFAESKVGLDAICFSPTNAGTPTSHQVFIDNIRNGDSAQITGTAVYDQIDPIFVLAGSSARVIVLDSTSTEVLDTTVTLDASGNFTVPHTLADGSYTLAIKGLSHLNASAAITIAGGAASGGTLTMKGGDANDDNSVDLLDYFLLSDSYNLAEGDAGFDVGADFNRDTSVDLLDYFILSDNYNAAGDVDFS